MPAQSCRFTARDLRERHCDFEPLHDCTLLFPGVYTKDGRNARGMQGFFKVKRIFFKKWVFFETLGGLAPVRKGPIG